MISPTTTTDVAPPTSIASLTNTSSILNSTSTWRNSTAYSSILTTPVSSSVIETHSSNTATSQVIVVTTSLNLASNPSALTSSGVSEAAIEMLTSTTLSHYNLSSGFEVSKTSTWSAPTLVPSSYTTASYNSTEKFQNQTISTSQSRNSTTGDANSHSIDSNTSTQLLNATAPHSNKTAFPTASAATYTNSSAAASSTANVRKFKALASTAALTQPKLEVKKMVFAHYMIGNTYEANAHLDIDSAAAIGLDGFALNILDPSQPFVRQSLNYMFDYTRDNFADFKLFISMDLWAAKADGDYLSGFDAILRDFKGHGAYLLGPNGYSFVSTFSAGKHNGPDFRDWKATWANEVYFVPNFDATQGYFTADPGWWDYWSTQYDVVDGLFSWDSIWPERGSTNIGDLSRDEVVLKGAADHNKTYMVGLSPLQYKNAYGTNYYRNGGLNLPARMEKILSLDPGADYVEIVSWNDKGESHYIGFTHLEQNNDTYPMKYANEEDWKHIGWQPLISSFITAFKNKASASEMRPGSGKVAVGAIWYKTILQSAVCPNEDENQYTAKTDGWETGNDNLNWAVVLPENGASMWIRLISDGSVLATIAGQPGLNYGAQPSVLPGQQRMELLDSSGNILLAAAGGRCVSDGCPDCIYNMNYQVVELTADTGAVGKCPYAMCKKAVFVHYMVGNVYAEHAHQDIDNAASLGIDAFALNVGDPTQDYVRVLFNNIFDYARDNHPNFKLFISMDLWAEGNAFQELNAGDRLAKYHDLLRDFLGHDAWYKGPNGYPFISTYSSGGATAPDWVTWKNTWGQKMYFVPGIDDTAGYNTSDPGWWAYWGDIVDGIMSWETTWPKPGVTNPGDISVDEVVVQGTYDHSKSYIMPLSPLQYKNSYDTNYYRQGDLNLPLRMKNLLDMEHVADFIEYLTWNDGPECHYIGNLWSEQNNDTQPGLYANDDFPHTGWQPLLSSFITAYKAGLPASGMTTPHGEVAVGAMWYKTILSTTTCPTYLDSSSPLYKYTMKPNGWPTGTDQLNWAIVLPSSSTGLSIRAISNGQVISTQSVTVGLNYGSASGVSAGQQRLELVDSTGKVILAATGGRCIASDCPDCIYNMNPVVVPLVADTGAVGTCPAMDCAWVSSDSNYVYDNMIWNWVNPAIVAPLGVTNLLEPSPLPTTVILTAYTTITLANGAHTMTSFLFTTFPISEVSYEPFTIASTDGQPGNVITYNPIPRVTAPPYAVTPPAGYSVVSTAAPGGGQLNPTSTAAGGIVYITWLPTISYSLPSYITTKGVAPSTIPNDSNSPVPTPALGVTDCSSSTCTQGSNCSGDSCTRGGDCTGPNCTKGGDCTGQNCVRGGDCIGDKCEEGGDCSGDSCVEGGGCSGAHCNKGGRCSGAHCHRGGGCRRTIFVTCDSNDCFGPLCGCVGLWCDNDITITIGTLPAPTCITNCPTLPPCAPGNAACAPCSVDGCPPARMPTENDCTSMTTAKTCTETISSTIVATSPQVSWSTTTQTSCETQTGCDVAGITYTTTVSSSVSADPTAVPSGILDYIDNNTDSPSDFAGIEADYSAWESAAEAAAKTMTTSTPTTVPPITVTVDGPTTTVTVTTPTADCAFWDYAVYFNFEVYNIDHWSLDGGAALEEQESGCGALTGWTWQDATSTSLAIAYFNLPFFIAEGCVERAIVSAGGPKISCQGQGFGKRDDQTLAANETQELTVASPMIISDELQSLALEVYGMPPSSYHPPYVPMDWASDVTATTSGAGTTTRAMTSSTSD